LIEAVTVKLKSQADYVRWWDGPDNEKHPGIRYGRGAAAIAVKAGEGGVPSRDVLKRWRNVLRDLKKATER
jgi:hypothetical protein